jgi:hypothetical protein
MINENKCGGNGQATGDNIIGRSRFACWLTKVTNTNSDYAILIPLPRQQKLHERSSLLRHSYVACLVTAVSVPGIIKLL